jgi:hypothetical protein
VIDLVLCTDIASPERVQIVKSKWKEAFGDAKSTKNTANLSRSIQATMFDSFHKGTDYQFRNSALHSEIVEPEAMVSINNKKNESNNDNIEKPSIAEDTWKERNYYKMQILNENLNKPLKRSFLKKLLRKSTSFVREKNIFRKSRKSDTQGASEMNTIGDAQTATAAASGIDNIKEFLSEYEEDNFSASSKSSSVCDVLDSSSRKMMIKPPNIPSSSRRLFNRRNKSLGPNDQSTIDDALCQNGYEESNIFQSETKRSSEPTETQSERFYWGLASVGENGRKSSFIMNQASSTHGKRFSEPTMGYMDRKKFHFKLGIRRALDFTGSSIESYKTDMLHKSDDPDQPDELKMMVTLEQMIKAADVAANMQRWETMLLWTNRLFEEQKNCFINDHGPDPEHDWHENQIAFFESYTMPLACRLVDTSVFELEAVEQFVNGVRQNNIRWMVEGVDIVSSMVKAWNSSHTNFS